MFNYIISLSRFKKNLIFVIVDSLTLILVLLAAFSLRLEQWYFPTNDLIWVFFGAPILAMPIFISFGIYHATTRYIGFSALWKISKAVSLYALLWGFIIFLAA